MYIRNLTTKYKTFIKRKYMYIHIYAYAVIFKRQPFILPLSKGIASFNISLSSNLLLLHHQIASARMCGCIGELKTHFPLIFLVKLAKQHLPARSECSDLDLTQKRYSECKIGIKLHFSKTAVHNDIKNSQNYGTFSDIGRRRRLMKMSIKDDYMMKHIATHSPSCKSVRELCLQKVQM